MIKGNCYVKITFKDGELIEFPATEFNLSVLDQNWVSVKHKDGHISYYNHEYIKEIWVRKVD